MPIRSMLWRTSTKLDKVQKLEVICANTGDVYGLNKWVGKYKDANLNTIQINNRLPLHLACSHGFINLVKCLVEVHSVTVTSIDEHTGCTALHYATSGGSSEVVQYLVEHCNLQVSTPADSGYTPVHHGCLEGHWKLVHYLLACGANYGYSKVVRAIAVII